MCNSDCLEEFVLHPRDKWQEILDTLAPGSYNHKYFNLLDIIHHQPFCTTQVDNIHKLGTETQHKELVNRWRLANISKLSQHEKKALFDDISLVYNLDLNHSKDVWLEDSKNKYSSELDQAFISWEKLSSEAFKQASLDPFQFNAHSLALLATDVAKLQPQYVDTLLSNNTSPDLPNMVMLYASQLSREQQPLSFASLNTSPLSLSQLESLRKIHPSLIENRHYINQVIDRIWDHTLHLQRNPADFEKALTKVVKFIKDLPLKFHDIKSIVYYHFLKSQIEQGKYHERTLCQYLEIPKIASYCHATWAKKFNDFHPSSSSSKFSSPIVKIGWISEYKLPPFETPTTEEESRLITKVIVNFFKHPNATIKPFKPFIDDHWLNNTFIEAKILYSSDTDEINKNLNLLHPPETDSIRNKVILSIDDANPKFWSHHHKVVFNVSIKNIPQLIVKVYEINTLRYYRDKMEEIPNNLILEGMTPTIEQQRKFDASPYHCRLETFEFPCLDSRSGVFMIEWMAGEKSIRYIVKKGGLDVIMVLTLSGHAFLVFDKEKNRITTAKLILDGRVFEPDDQGELIIPYADTRRKDKVIVFYEDPQSHKTISTLYSFEHRTEDYKFSVGFCIDPESLYPLNKTSVLIKPKLVLNEEVEVPLSYMEQCKLEITSRSPSKMATKTDINLNDEILTYDFLVPAKLENLKFEICAKITRITDKSKIELRSSQEFVVNSSDHSQEPKQYFLRRAPNLDYVLNVLGKSGEPIVNKVVNIKFNHRHFTSSILHTFITDQNGHILLGRLKDIDSIIFDELDCFRLNLVQQLLPERLDILACEDFKFPVTFSHDQSLTLMKDNQQAKLQTHSLSTEDVAFYAVNTKGQTISDMFHKLSYDQGLLHFRQIPSGLYILLIKHIQHKISIRITNSRDVVTTEYGQFIFDTNETVVSDRRLIDDPLQIKDIVLDANNVNIQLHNMTPDHLDNLEIYALVNEFVPMDCLSKLFDYVHRSHPKIYPPIQLESTVAMSRLMSEEHQYIINRQYLSQFPGNTLKFPSLLLNPRLVDISHSELNRAKEGTGWEEEDDHNDSFRQPKHKSQSIKSIPYANSDAHSFIAYRQNMEFKASPSKILKLQVSDQGLILIPRSTFEKGLQKAVLMTLFIEDHKGQQTIQAQYVLPHYDQDHLSMKLTPIESRDMRLSPELALDVGKYYAQKSKIVLLEMNDMFKMSDYLVNEIKVVDSLQQVFDFLLSRTDGKLKSWSWLLSWHTFNDSQKEKIYHEFASHELHLFIYFKDRNFFDSHLLPYLRQKTQKSFIDHWLLETEASTFYSYLQPARFSQLNALEKALLVRRLNVNDAQRVTQYLLKAFEAQSLNQDFADFNDLFDQVLDPFSYDESMLDKSDYSKSDNVSQDTLDSGTISTKESESLNPSFKASHSPINIMGRMKRSHIAPSCLLQAPSRRSMPSLYRPEQTTKQYGESYYYGISRSESSKAELIPLSGFWVDYAQYGMNQVVNPSSLPSSFLSSNWIYATNNLHEMLAVLVLLDLVPLSSSPPSLLTDKMTVISPTRQPSSLSLHIDEERPSDSSSDLMLFAKSPAILFYKGILESSFKPSHLLLTYQQYFDPSDENKMAENNVTEFLTGRAYGCKIVVLSTSSIELKLNLLFQIPIGSISLCRSGIRSTKVSESFRLLPYNNMTFTFYFYFPSSGDFPHLRSLISADGTVISVARPMCYPIDKEWTPSQEQQVLHSPNILHVSDKTLNLDQTSWNAYISRHADQEVILNYLRDGNIWKIDLTQITWCMQDRGFYFKVTDLLAERLIFSKPIWAYILLHYDLPSSQLGDIQRALQDQRLSEFLEHDPTSLIELVGYNAEFKQLDVSTCSRGTQLVEFFEFWPLINARAHQLGSSHKILDQKFKEIYKTFLGQIVLKSDLDKVDYLQGTYYLLIQNRIDEARRMFSRSMELDESSKFNSSKQDGQDLNDILKLQIDYLRAYLSFYDNPLRAKDIISEYISYPIFRWRQMFLNIQSQLDEILCLDPTMSSADLEGPLSIKGIAHCPVTDEERTGVEKNELTRLARLESLSQVEPSIEFQVQPGKIILEHDAVNCVEIAFYKMEIELLFSKFVPDKLIDLAYVQPNLKIQVLLSETTEHTTTIDLPQEIKDTNVMIEVTTGNLSKVAPYFSSQLLINISEQSGLLRVRSKRDAKPCRAAYVKVYAQHIDGERRFYKDGYTDQRGAFDYVSLSTNELKTVQKFSILVIASSEGARIIEANPPAQS